MMDMLFARGIGINVGAAVTLNIGLWCRNPPNWALGAGIEMIENRIVVVIKVFRCI